MRSPPPRRGRGQGEGELARAEGAAQGAGALRHRRACLVEGGLHSHEAVGDAVVAGVGGGDARAREGLRVALALVAEWIDLRRDDERGGKPREAGGKGGGGAWIAPVG